MQATADDVLKVFSSVLPGDIAAKLDPAKPFTAQGVDSLALTALAVAVQNAFKVKISPEDGIGLKTVNDVVAYLAKAGA